MDYQKKRRPGYYSNKSKKPRNFTLEPGLKGFICTCNIRERDCIREAYNILNEYADKIFGNEKESKNWREQPETVDKESDGEIETALSNEIESLRAESKKPPNTRRFQVVESGANNCLFIRTNLDDPVKLVHHIVEDIETSKKQKTRFLLRLLPIEVTCKAHLDEIKEKVSPLFDKYFTKEEKTFSIIINRRNSNMLSRDEAIGELAEMIKMRNINNRVDLKQPQLTVVIEIIRSMCCIGVLPDYFRFRKYNLLELASPEGKKEEGNSAQIDGSGDAGVTETEAGVESGAVETQNPNATEENSKESCNKSLHSSENSEHVRTDSEKDGKDTDKSESQDTTMLVGEKGGGGDNVSQKTESDATDVKQGEGIEASN